MSNSSCPIIPSTGYALPLETYYNDPQFQVTPTYATTIAMERVFQWTYRWNQNTDIEDLLREDASRDDKTSYLIGIMWASFAILLFALLWLILLVCCKWWGPQRVGFFSARRLRPSRPDEPTEALEKRELMYKSQRHNDGGVPFQQNGIASGYDEMGKPIKKKSKTKKLVKGTIQAPKKLVKGTIRAPKKIYSSQKKKFQQTFNKTKKFARINSAGDIDLGDYLDEVEQAAASGDKASQATSPNSPSTQPKRSALDGISNENGSVLLMTQQDERLLRDYDVEIQKYYKVCDARNARMRRIRVTTAVSALGMVTAAVLFVVMGIPTLYESSQVTGEALQKLQQQTQQLQQAVTVLQARQQETSIATEKFILDVNGFCPNAAEQFCSDVNNIDQRGCDFSSLPQLQSELDAMMQYFDGTFDLVVQEQALVELQNDLQTVEYLLDRANAYYPTTINWAFWVAVGCNLTLAVVCGLISISVMLLYFGHPLPVWLKALRSYAMVPIFLLLVVLGWIFSSIFIISAIGFADACINSPDAVMMTILERLQGEFSTNSVLYDFFAYYISGCPVQMAPQDLEQRIVIMTQLIVPALQNVGTAMDQVGMTNLQQVCGVEDMSIFASKLSAMETQLCNLSQSVLTARLLLNCPDWVQWYQLAAYQGICYYNSTGLAWAASTQLVMVILSMVILTLRISFYELNEVADESNNCLSNWCCCVEVIPEEDDEEDESEYDHPSTDGSQYDEDEGFEEENEGEGSYVDEVTASGR